MPHLDLNLTEMRREILERQHEAMRPFQEELRKLDILEEMMQKESNAVSPSVEFAMQPLTETEYKKLPNRGGRRKAKPNGHAEPKQFSKLKRYAKMHQPEAVLTILTAEPGLSARDVTLRMIEGGFPFKATKPYASMIQVIGDMTKKGMLRQERPASREGGQVNTYYVNQEAR